MCFLSELRRGVSREQYLGEDREPPKYETRRKLLDVVKQVVMIQDGCLVDVVTLMPWPVRGAEVVRHSKLITSKPANVGLVLKIEAG